MVLCKAVCCGLWGAGVLLGALTLGPCNSPYSQSDADQNILYTTFSDEPKHLDPARAFSTDEAGLMCQVLEPPFQYHFLKRPYALVPLTAREIPKAEKRAVRFRGRRVDATVYRVRIKPGIRYRKHPCFVKSNRRLKPEDVADARSVWDIQPAATRELVAADYVYGVRRLADPRLACPVFSILAENLLGMAEYQQELQRRLDARRAERRKEAGVFYNQEGSERYDPIRLDYSAGADAFPFVRLVDPNDACTFEVVLRQPYPQILYWMAMAFFAPVPPEATEFFAQRALLKRSLIFDKNPVGTGPYWMREFDPTNQIVLQRNEDFHEEYYPSLPEPAAADAKAVLLYEELNAAGMLDDAGRRLPMVDRIIFRMEKESIPRWNKFLQGYYDTSGITSDLFDQAVTMTSQGDSVLSDEMADRGIQLLTSSSTTVSYYAFNMADGVVGGYGEEKRKLRQAISIAFDIKEEITVFANDRGIPAQSPLPPGIFGHGEGAAGINPVVYRWDARRNRGVRRSLDEAKALLAEAGYPGGYGPDNRPLEIRFATTAAAPGARAWLKFVKKQFDKLNIRLVAEISDYNRFRDKAASGNFQFLRWGWVADYPDPENFLFLLYGPNGKIAAGGENVANYQNDRYDERFERMRAMDNTPERLAIIREMAAILQQDSPWIFGTHPVAFGLHHKWYRNAYPHAMAFNTMKYKRIDTPERARYRAAHNQPRLWPVIIFAALLAGLTVPAVRVARKHFREA